MAVTREDEVRGRLVELLAEREQAKAALERSSGQERMSIAWKLEKVEREIERGRVLLDKFESVSV